MISPEERRKMMLLKHVLSRVAVMEENERHRRMIEDIRKRYREAKIKRPFKYADELGKEYHRHHNMTIEILKQIDDAFKIAETEVELKENFEDRLRKLKEKLKRELKDYYEYRGED